MKKFFFALMSLSMVASAQTQNVRLSKTDQTQSPTLPNITVQVLADGGVERVSFIRASHLSPQHRFVTQMSDSELANINALIEEARLGEIQLNAHHALCFRAPDYSALETADNGNVFLYSGNVCSTSRSNAAPAAAQLRSIIDELYSKYANNN